MRSSASVLGVLLGIAVSFVLMRFSVLNELTTPLAVAINAVPIVIIVPVSQQHVSGRVAGSAQGHGRR